MNQEMAREILVKHSQSKTNGVFPQLSNFEAKLTNPICGDHVEIKFFAVDEVIQEIGHKAEACAICSASASILTETVKGLKISEALEIGELFQKSVIESKDLNWPEKLSALLCFEHLRVNPSRRMCALLPWVTLKNATRGNHD